MGKLLPLQETPLKQRPSPPLKHLTTLRHSFPPKPLLLRLWSNFARTHQLGHSLFTPSTSPMEPNVVSFTTLLDLPPTQAMELLHSPPQPRKTHFNSHPLDHSSPEKRKEREKKGKGSVKKKKSKVEGDEKLPYVHVRARRGQATDSHSLAERARREKINARMKLLQELVPGCTKISGTTLVLDEIISHVQSLQRQVEFLSMRLAEVDPRINFNLDSMLTAESGSVMDSNFSAMLMPLMWPQGQVNGGSRQQWHVDAVQQPVWGREEDNHNLIASENSLLSYDSSANSAAHQSSQLKVEL